MHEFCVYLDWAGWKPEVWAAWAQALLSAAAIFFTGRFAAKQERRQIARRIDIYVVLLDQAEAIVRTTLISGKQGVHPLRRNARFAGPKLRQLAKVFEGVSVEQLPDFRLIAIVHDSADLLNQCAGVMETIAIENLAPESTGDEVKKGFELLEVQVRFFNDAADIANEYASPTLRQRWRRFRMNFGASN